MTSKRSQDQSLFRLADVVTIDQLSRALGVPLEIFRDAISCSNPNDIYYKHKIPKRNPNGSSRFRTAWESKTESLARSHKAVARRLDDFARRRDVGYPSSAVHGYMLGGSTKSNASPHCGARILVRADIKDFFPSISLDRIESLLCDLGVAPEPANALARFVTIQGQLPLGLPESPVLSNLVCLPLDRDFEKFANEHGITYTRYADDLTFSGSRNLPNREQISAILEKYNFQLAGGKFKKSKHGQAHFVTGLSVSDREGPHVPRVIKRKLRSELYYCEKFGLQGHADRIKEDQRTVYLRLAGMLNYVAFVERGKGGLLRQQWQRIQQGYFGPKSHLGVRADSSKRYFIVVDETEFKVGADSYLALCFVRLSDLCGTELLLERLLGDYKTKPGAKGDLKVLDQVGIHFSDAHFDLRTVTLDLMVDVLEWSAAIRFAKIASPKEYSRIYGKMFLDLARQEFEALYGAEIQILIEESDKISLGSIRGAVQAEYARFEEAGTRRPTKLPDMEFVGKSSTRSITLPDFALAAFRAYAMRVSDDRVLDFERIRDRIRYVADTDAGTFYSRKHPFLGLAEG